MFAGVAAEYAMATRDNLTSSARPGRCPMPPPFRLRASTRLLQASRDYPIPRDFTHRGVRQAIGRQTSAATLDRTFTQVRSLVLKERAMELTKIASFCTMFVLPLGCAPAERQAQRESVISLQGSEGRLSRTSSEGGNVVSGPAPMTGQAPARAAAFLPKTGAAATEKRTRGVARVYIARAKSAVNVLGLLSPGRLEIVNGCLTVLVREGERSTPVFPPGVSTIRSGRDISAIRYGSRVIRLNAQVAIPGGGAAISPSDLVAPVPVSCPQTLFAVGG